MTRSMKTILRVALSILLLLGTLASAQGALPGVTLLGTLAGELRAPGKMALDPLGNLYVTDVQSGGIVKFDADSRLVKVIKVSGVVRSLALTPDGKLLVSHDARVTVHDLDGVAVGELSGYSFQQANGIALDGSGNIYVADSKGNTIARFAPQGTFLGNFGKSGKRQGELNFPTALAFERGSNQIAVVDTLNNRVQFFDTDGVFKRSIGTPTRLSGPLSFAYPDGIAFDYSEGVRMYVSDGYQQSIQVIDLEEQPKFVGFLGSYGKGEGEFQQLSDVLFDQQTRTLIAADATGTLTFLGIGSAEQGDPSGFYAGNGGVLGIGSKGGDGSVTTPLGGSSYVKSGEGSKPSGGSRGPVSWAYPSGIDCRHGKAGSVICR